MKELTGYSFIPAKKLSLDGFKKTNSNKFYLEADKNGIEIVKDKELAKFTVDNIFKKAVVQPTYCVGYVKLIKLLGDNGFDIGLITTNKCEQYTELLKKEEALDGTEDLNYDEFCEKVLLI